MAKSRKITLKFKPISNFNENRLNFDLPSICPSIKIAHEPIKASVLFISKWLIFVLGAKLQELAGQNPCNYFLWCLAGESPPASQAFSSAPIAVAFGTSAIRKSGGLSHFTPTPSRVRFPFQKLQKPTPAGSAFLWCLAGESNPQPTDSESVTLSVELTRHINFCTDSVYHISSACVYFNFLLAYVACPIHDFNFQPAGFTFRGNLDLRFHA